MFFCLFECFCLFPVAKSNQATAKQIPVLADREFFFFFCCCFFHFELVLFCICYVALTQMLKKTEGDNTSAPLLIHSSKQYPAIDPC